MKRKNPYQYLLEDVKEFARKVDNPKRMMMWRYPEENLKGNWELDNLAQRVSAAAQLGYDVELNNTEEGLEVWYVEKRPDIPYNFKY